jgi:hypothetical protein
MLLSPRNSKILNQTAIYTVARNITIFFYQSPRPGRRNNESETHPLAWLK